MKPIETSYKGYRFRSRLEARWAVFFSALGLTWEYEPEGFDLGDGVYYLPDFKVYYPGGAYWFEVKASDSVLSVDEVSKVNKFGDIIMLIGPPEFQAYPSCQFGYEPNDYGYFLWSYKNRPWHDDKQNFCDMCDHMNDDSVSKLIRAVNLARSARFEHGESPAC